MVLYCVEHPAGIIRAIVHKLKYHKNDRCVIIGELPVGSLYYPQIPNITYVQSPNMDRMAAFSNEREELLRSIQVTIDGLMASAGLRFADFDSIYAIYDMYCPYTLYFEINNIHYMCIELDDNKFQLYYTSGDFLIRDRQPVHRCFNTLLLELHSQDATGKNCLKGYLYSKNSVAPQKNSGQFEIFGYLDSLLSLDCESKDILISAYKIGNYSFDNIFLFTSHGVISRELRLKDALVLSTAHSDEEQASMFYLQILDYYFQSKDIVLKLHPKASNTMIASFSDFQQIPVHIPIEIFSLASTDNKVTAFSLWSSSEEICRRAGWGLKRFGTGIIPFFKVIHLVNLALQFIEKVSVPDKIYIYGLDIQQLDYFVEFAYTAFQAVEFVQLLEQNVAEAKCILAVPDEEFYALAHGLSDETIVIVKGKNRVGTLKMQAMRCTVVNISRSRNEEIQSFTWSVSSNNREIIDSSSRFCSSYSLKHAQLRIQSSPWYECMTSERSLDKHVRESHLLSTLKFLQMYYEVEKTGYTFRDYLEERGLLADNIKLAFFAADELGVMVYNICKRLHINFTVSASDMDREISFHVHPDLTESLSCAALETISKDNYTRVFMATTWNSAQTNYVRRFHKPLFLFDAVVSAMYTRRFYIDKIASIRQKYPGIKTGIIFIPSIQEIKGLHSPVEEYFLSQKIKRLTQIKDESMKEMIINNCYRQYGCDDEYIENVCDAVYTAQDYNGISLLEDHESKYSNVSNHQRVTTDQPADASATVYLFGDSVVTGVQVDDSGTIASHLQRIINTNKLPYIVQNRANVSERRYDPIFALTETIHFKPDDILLFAVGDLDWETHQYIKQNNTNLLSGSLGIYTMPVFQRPHDHGEVFTDDHHFNAKGYGLIARKIFDDMKAAGFFNPYDIAEDAGTGTE